MPGRRILVTGGFGFLGTHLVEILLEEGSWVHVVDDLSTSPVDVPAYLKGLGNPKQLTYDLVSVEDYCRERRAKEAFEEIFHLASVVGPVGVLEHAGKILGKIVGDTYRVMDLAAAAGAMLCDVSTSEVYGGGRDGYCSEADAKIIPPKVSVRLEYAVAKLACEVALINATRVGGLSAVIVRPFNIAGPRQSARGGFVLPRFITQALRGDALTVFGDGQAIRAFTHVRDVAAGVVQAARRGSRGEIYNLGNGANKTTILELAERVLKVTGSSSRIEFIDPKALFGPLFEEANDKYPDADRAMRELEWRPRHGLDAVIEDSLAYIRADRRD